MDDASSGRIVDVVQVGVERSLTRTDFPVVVPVATRWADNDMFGHLNNAVYYQLFDTAINQWLIAGTGVDVMSAPKVVVTAETGCTFFREVGFPRPVAIGLRVVRVGRSSVEYQLGVFADDASGSTCDATVYAVGHWVHVYVDRISRKSVDVPTAVRRLLRDVLVESPDGTGPA